MKLFIDNVPNLVGEVAIVAPISAMFRPKDVLGMESELVSAIAAESDEKKSVRDKLSNKHAVLESGKKTCKQYATRESASKLSCPSIRVF